MLVTRAPPSAKVSHRIHLKDWTRSGAINLFSFDPPVFQPSSRADWRVGVAAKKFMQSFN